MADVGNNIVSSLNRLMMTDDDSSSVHQVMSNDDLLIEILLRLPVISLFFFKYVSKRLLSLITSSYFNLRASRFPKIDPPCGFFLQDVKYKYKYDFVSLYSRIPQSKKKKSEILFGCFGTDSGTVEILQSCNGLVLCVNRTNPDHKIYVYNPTLNMFKMLPPVCGLNHNRHLDKMKLGFDPAKSPHYKVLLVRKINHGVIQTRTYSSETGCWRRGDNFTFPIEWSYEQFDRGVYWNDAIHWINDTMNRIINFKLDVEYPRITSTTPPETLGLVDRYNYKELFESRGCLLLACSRDPHNSKRLEIYEKRNEYCGWSARYVVRYVDSIEAFFKTWKLSTGGRKRRGIFRCDEPRWKGCKIQPFVKDSPHGL